MGDPITVRYKYHNNKLYIYAVNKSPVKASVRIELDKFTEITRPANNAQMQSKSICADLDAFELRVFVPSNLLVSYQENLKVGLNHACVAFFMEDCEIVDEEEVYFEKIDNKEKTVIESIYVPFCGKVPNVKTIDCLSKIVEEQKNMSHCYSNLYCSKNIVDLILSIAIKQHFSDIKKYSDEYYCEKVERFLFANYGDSSLDMNVIASCVNLHPNYLSTIYKHYKGKTILNRLREIRIDEAKRLLSLNKYFVKDIAKMVGILDGNYFSVVFKREVGQSPEDYAIEIAKNNV